MKIDTLYSVKIKEHSHIFKESVSVYRDAVDFLISVCIDNWEIVSSQKDGLHKKKLIEHLVHKTSRYPDPAYSEFSSSLDSKDIKLFEDMYNFFHEKRHPHMHSTDSDATTTIVGSFDDAITRLDEIIHTMKVSYSKYVV